MGTFTMEAIRKVSTYINRWIEMEPIINVVDLYKLYFTKQNTRAILALNGCNLKIQSNEFVSIIGPNGSGKTTLLRIIGGFEGSTTAKMIHIDNNDLLNLHPNNIIYFRRNTIGFIDQFPYTNLHSTLTVEKNLMLPLSLKGISWSEIKTTIRTKLKEWNLFYLKNRSSKSISNGEALRISLLMATMKEPSILLADEPTGQLDNENTEFLIEMIRNLQKEQKMTTIVATHDYRLAEKTDKTFIIRDGKTISLTLDIKKFLLTSSVSEKISKFKELLSEHTFSSIIDTSQQIHLPDSIIKKFEYNNQVQFHLPKSGNYVIIKPKKSANNYEQLLVEKESTEDDSSIEKIKVLLSNIQPISNQEKYENYIISLTDLTKTFTQDNNNYPIFKDFNLHINYGDFVVLMGPSGSGKTTLLKILSGLMKFDDGKLRILGHSFVPSRYSSTLFSKIRKYDIGVISQQWNLYPNSTILENFYLNYFLFEEHIKTSKTQQFKLIFEQMLKNLGLYYDMNRSIENMSWGEQQRLAIVLTIIKRPKIILADEPTANLDAHSSKIIINILQYLNDTGTTIIMATHDLSLVTNKMVTIPLGKYSE